MSVVLVIAGTDPGGGAGLLRDVQTLNALGVTARCAVTAVTAQTDAAVWDVRVMSAELVRAQIAAAFAAGPVAAIKIGMLATADTVVSVAQALHARPDVPLVLDPVLASSSGAVLLDEHGQQALREHLLPRSLLLTPNIPEAAALLGEAPAGSESEALAQGLRLLALGPQAVLLKGGHASGADAVDLLLARGEPVRRLGAARLAAGMRGSGCALACAIAAHLARGLDLQAACRAAKTYVTALIEKSGTARL